MGAIGEVGKGEKEFEKRSILPCLADYQKGKGCRGW